MFSFNSILVQLEVDREGVIPLVDAEFQFHIGAIRSSTCSSASKDRGVTFQFHIGAIRSRSDFGWKVAILLRTES